MSNRFLVGMGVGMVEERGPVERGEEGGKTAHLSSSTLSPSLSSNIFASLSRFCSVTSFGGTPRRLAKITGLCWDCPACCWSVPADGCVPRPRPLHPPAASRSPSLCCCNVVALARAPTTLSLSKKTHTHTKKHTLLDIKMGPLRPKRTTSFIYVRPRGVDTRLTGCLSDVLETTCLSSPPSLLSLSF